MKTNEMAILKAASIKLDNDRIAIVTMMYHVEDDPTTAKVDRTKSEYHWVGRIAKISDIQTEIANMKAAPTEKWKWPGLDQKWDISYGDDTNGRGYRWLESRIKKAVDVETGFKILSGWKKSDNQIRANRAYDVTNYSTPNGEMTLTAENINTIADGFIGRKIVHEKKARKANAKGGVSIVKKTVVQNVSIAAAQKIDPATEPVPVVEKPEA